MWKFIGPSLEGRKKLFGVISHPHFITYFNATEITTVCTSKKKIDIYQWTTT